jgi:hypothetical protein
MNFNIILVLTLYKNVRTEKLNFLLIHINFKVVFNIYIPAEDGHLGF